jgi:thymidylate kinase
LLFLLHKIIARPDAIILLENNPEEVYKRKQELSLNEIKNQIILNKNIIKKFPGNTFIVKTENGVEKTHLQIQNIIMETINKQLKSTDIASS